MFGKRKKGDAAFVRDISAGDREAESLFYEHCRAEFSKVSSKLPDCGPKEAVDLFQDAFLVVWTEIQNGKIYCVEGGLYRMGPYGNPRPMTCSLSTFVNDIALNMHRKSLRHDGPAKVADISGAVSLAAEEDRDEAARAQVVRAVEDCIEALSERCRQILTMFYFKKMNLDEILAAREENVSKDGLKTSKNKCMNKLRSDVYIKIGYGLER